TIDLTTICCQIEKQAAGFIQKNQLIMPPHRLYRLSPYISSQAFWRGAKSLIVLSTLVLAGCATNNQNQFANSSMLVKAERDLYLSQTQSDPLGAYLANREQSY